MLKKSGCMACASLAVLAGLCAAAPAQAQDESSTQSDYALDEVIVTASRRTENVQRSSLSIQVMSAEDLTRNGTNGPRDLNALVPGLAVSQGGTYTQTFIRGVGDITSNTFGSNGVMYTIDGVVIDRPTTIAPNFFDLARVEVLKGPQGTLYGRNSTGGAINLISRRPEDTFGGYLNTEIGNYNLTNVSGALNVPLSDALSVRGAFSVINRDGYLSDGRNDDVRQAGRLSISYTPSDDFSLLVTGDLQHIGGKGPGGVVTPLPAGASPWTGPSDPLVTAQLRSLSAVALLPSAANAFYDGDFSNLMIELNKDVGFGRLTVVGGYRRVEAQSNTAQPGFETALDESSRQISLEARLSGESDTLKWVAGGLYFDQEQSSTLEVFLNNVAPFSHARFQISDLPTRSAGLFGEVTYSVTPEWRIIGGARYTDERKEMDGTVTHLGTNSLGAAGVFPVTGEEHYSKVTWRAGTEFDLSPENMLYATVSTGFKAGGFAAVPPPNQTYRPEFLTAYQIGSRNRFLDSRLQINVEGFYWKYTDYQASVLGPQPNGFTGTATLNAGSATIYGVDVDVVAKLTADDTLRFVAEYLNTNFDSFTFDRSTNGLIAGVTTGCRFVGAARPSPYGGNVQTLDCSGLPLQRSPEWSGSASYQHVFPLSRGDDLDFKATVSFATSRFISIEYTPLTRTGGYRTLDLDLTYHAPDNQFALSGFVRNVTEEAVYTGGVFQPLSAGRLLYQTIGAPRTYGVRLSVDF